MWFLGVIPRRTFLSGLAVWGGAGAIRSTLPKGGMAFAPAPGLCSTSRVGASTDLKTSGSPLDRGCAEVFERQLGTAFRIFPDDAATPQVVRLTKVTRSQTIAQPGPAGTAQPTPVISLIFSGPSGSGLLQNTYRVEHSQLGVFALFLVPIGPIQGDVCYQAIFA
jgi:hypothetical protein